MGSPILFSGRIKAGQININNVPQPLSIIKYFECNLNYYNLSRANRILNNGN